MRQQTIVVLCLASGFVGGYALSPITWQMLGAFTSNQSELPEVSSGPALIDVMALVSVEKGASDSDVRVGIARALDTHLVDNGYEARVSVRAEDQNRVLLINGLFGRVETMNLARRFDFGSLQRAGFKIFATGVGREAQGYLIDEVMADEKLRAPVDWNTLDRARESMDNP